MSLLKRNWMATSIMSLCAISLLGGCSTQTAHEKAAAETAQEKGLSAVDSRFDGVFVAPDANFAKYKRIQIEALDVDNVEILRSDTGPGQMRTPWVLNDSDKEQYRGRYLESITRYLLADGRFSTTPDNAQDVLVLRSRILQIAPLASKDDSQGRPTIMKAYSEGMGTMTIEMMLFDAATGKAVAIVTDRRDLGRLFEENNRATNSVHVRNAFNAWLKRLRSELDALSQQ